MEGKLRIKNNTCFDCGVSLDFENIDPNLEIESEEGRKIAVIGVCLKCAPLIRDRFWKDK